ncbi:hypothetical protein [Methylocaldum sp. 14B]|jgi:SOS-response transcriptional repressor LexA|nr:hypothetical protein [Methylocaldum sp. 14B]
MPLPGSQFFPKEDTRYGDLLVVDRSREPTNSVIVIAVVKGERR